MIKYKVFLIVFIFIFKLFSFAQRPSAINSLESFELIKKYRLKNSLLLELGGGGRGLSLNYERTIINSQRFFFNCHVGYEYFIIQGSSYSLSGNFGKNNKYIEFGFGGTNYIVKVFKAPTGPFNYFYPFIGFRYQEKFVFKIQVLFFIPQSEVYRINLHAFYAGISFGRAFNFGSKSR